MAAVSFVVPVHNGERWLPDVMAAIARAARGHVFEIVAVDDASTDGSLAWLREATASFPMHVLEAGGRGAAAAVNLGLRAARFPLVGQVDQDVVVSEGWLSPLVAALDDSAVAAAQGCYVADPAASWCARVTARDLEARYAAISPADTDQVCTGNSLYRASALRDAGGFDEQLGYGYDNDMSYRLRNAGHRLVICRAATSVHRLREGLLSYCAKQYGFGYGRLELVAKHPTRITGDAVSPLAMMLHPAAMCVAVSASIAGVVLSATGNVRALPFWLSLAMVAALTAERAIAGVRAARRFRDGTPLGFPVLHFVRDLVWVAAILVWMVRRAGSRRSLPSHSMWRPARRYPSPNLPAK